MKRILYFFFFLNCTDHVVLVNLFYENNSSQYVFENGMLVVFCMTVKGFLIYDNPFMKIWGQCTGNTQTLSNMSALAAVRM